MSRTNQAIYNDSLESVDAIEVDDHLARFDKEKFTCLFCNTQVAFNRGIDHKDPHFKNWPNKPHLTHCEIEELGKQVTSSGNGVVESLVSTILARSSRLKLPSDEFGKRKQIQKLYGRR